jgi:hypothetical protein
MTGSSATSVSLGWNAATDNVGVTGYGLYRDGTLTGTGTPTSTTFSGLACGTSYALAIDAYDAAGNRSAKASMGASTAACPTQPPPSGSANVYVSPGGSDGTCVRRDSSSRARLQQGVLDRPERGLVRSLRARTAAASRSRRTAAVTGQSRRAQPSPSHR